MSSGSVVATSSTTICEPRSRSTASSLVPSVCTCSGVSVPVWSMTRPLSGGTGRTSWACAGHTSSASSSVASPRASRCSQGRACRAVVSRLERGPMGQGATVSTGAAGPASLRGRRVAAGGRRGRDPGLVLHREAGLDLVAEDLGGDVVREAARQRVVGGHVLDVAVARDGDAVLRAFELHAQVLEALVGLQVRVVLGD